MPEETASQTRSRGREAVPKVMMDLYHRGPHPEIAAEIVRGVMPKTVDSMHPGEAEKLRQLLTFELPALPSGEVLHSAQLRFTLVPHHSTLPGHKNGSIVKVFWGRGSLNASFSQQVQDLVLEEKVNFNCTDIIDKFHRMQNYQGGELRFVVEVQGWSLMLEGGVDDQPLLLLLYTPSEPTHEISKQVTTKPELVNSQHRRRRSLESEDYEEETNQVWGGHVPVPKPKGRRQKHFCKRRPMYVEFSDINYDTWIVAPNGYQAYQCVGRCHYPLSAHLSPTKHAIIQTLLHSANPGKATPSCCVPTRLESISVLYLDSQGVLTYRLSYRDMVVAECGCR